MNRHQLKEGLMPIGFGTGLLNVAGDPQGASNVVAAAYDAGLRYFDTARLYADGQAERIVGQVLSGRRDKVVVTSKAGILPIDPGFIGKAKRKFLGIGREPKFGVFAKSDLQKSLDTTLRALRTDYLDSWLLHEVAFEHIERFGLLDYLEAEKAAGRVRAYGLATSGSETRRIVEKYPALREIIQVSVDDFGALKGPALDQDGLVILHSVFARRMKVLQTLFATDSSARRTLTDIIGADCTQLNVIARLLLCAALADNPEGIVLFSSSKPDRIVEAVSSASGQAVEPAGLAFVREIFRNPAGTHQAHDHG